MLDGVDLLTARPAQLDTIRGVRIGFVFQDPLSSLNPVQSVGSQVAELFRIHRGLGHKAAMREAVEVLDRVQIPFPDRRARDYPHQFSGGMRQRVMIAISLALQPDVLIADEPTTALDVTVQAQIIELLGKLREEAGTALVLISHDLGVAAALAERLAVMYGGRLVEVGVLRDAYRRPYHPYTLGLLASGPRQVGQRLIPIPGAPPRPSSLPPGCAFHPRCTFAQDRCRVDKPALRQVAQGTNRCLPLRRGRGRSRRRARDGTVAQLAQSPAARQQALLEEARRSIAGGSLGLFTLPEALDLVVASGAGGHVTDVSGRDFLDFHLGSGPALLGHAHPDIVRAVSAQVAKGSTYYFLNEPAIELASAMVQAIPCAEELQFAGSGSEATLYALRIARAATGRDAILKFEGAWHGMNEYALWGTVPTSASPYPSARPDSAGIPEAISSQVLVAPFNDASAFDELIARHGTPIGSGHCRAASARPQAPTGFPRARARSHAPARDRSDL